MATTDQTQRPHPALPTDVSDHHRRASDDPSRGGEAESAPLASYATLIVTFNVAFGGFLIYTSRSKRRVAANIPPGEILLLGVTARKISQLITSSRATRVLRAPFAELRVSDDGHADERPRGAGMRKALGELLTCPHCTGVWVAGGLTAARVVRPRETAVVAAAFTILSVAEALQSASKVVQSQVGRT
jgi:hypothetical protein